MKNLGTMVVFLISAPVHLAMAGTLREDATTLTVLKRIPIARDNDDLKKNENAYFQDGALLKTLNFDRPFCALVVRADVNPIKGANTPLTFEEGQRILRGYIRLDVPEPLRAE